MEDVMILVQLIVVLTMIFIGAKVGGIGLGIYGMAGVFVLVFVFGLEPDGLYGERGCTISEKTP